MLNGDSVTMSRDHFKWLCEPGSVGGGALCYFAVLNRWPQFQGLEHGTVRDNTTGQIWAWAEYPDSGGVFVELVQRGAFKRAKSQGGLFPTDPAARPVKDRNQTDLF